MKKTTFTVTNLNPDFEFPSGFWFANRSDGGEVGGTPTPGYGTYADDKRGTWVWCNGTEFEIDGDVAVRGTRAFMLKQGLLQETFNWLPKNPAHHTVSPLLKDGTTANPKFNNDGNPLLFKDVGGPGDSTKAARTNDVCKHFVVTTTVVVAKKAKAKK